MFYLNVFYLSTLKDFVGHYKLWNEVMFWFTQMMCYNVNIPLLRESSFNMTRGDEDIGGGAPKIFRHPKGGL